MSVQPSQPPAKRPRAIDRCKWEPNLTALNMQSEAQILGELLFLEHKAHTVYVDSRMIEKAASAGNCAILRMMLTEE